VRFALCSETFVETPLDEAFAKIASFGYKGVEVAPFHATGMRRAEVARPGAVGPGSTVGPAGRPGATATATQAGDIRKLDMPRRAHLTAAAREAGLEVVGLHWLLARTEGMSVTSTDPGVRERTAGYLGELAELTAQLGGRVMVFGSPAQRAIGEDEGLEEALPRAAETFRRAAELSAKVGVELLIEPLSTRETRFVNTKDEAMRLIDEVGHDSFGLHLDCKAMAAEAKPMPQIVEEAAGIVRHFHANDEEAMGPGFGRTDLRPFAEAVMRTGYDGWISVEPFDTSPGPAVVAERSLAYLRECFGG
jgi:sugar phosphate isomerase/epimerase